MFEMNPFTLTLTKRNFVNRCRGCGSISELKLAVLGADEKIYFVMKILEQYWTEEL